MSCAALLDRDFIALPNIKISMNKDYTISSNDNKITNNIPNKTNNLIQQIMHIEYLDTKETKNNR